MIDTLTLAIAIQGADTMPHPTLDETYKPRTWACQECKCVLGVVMRDTNRVRRLWVFTRGCHAEHVPPEHILRAAPRGMYRVQGADSVSGGVECSHCGSLNEWRMSDEAFEKLMSRYPRRKTV